jgi:hypothetical protein
MNKGLLLLIFLTLTCCQSVESDVGRIYDEVYNYISNDDNSRISRMANKGNILLVDTIENIESVYINYPICNDSLFTQSDIDFMNIQNSNPLKFNLQNDTLKKIKLLPTDSLRKLLVTNKFKNVFFSVSQPLFTKNHEQALISINFNCSECGFGKLLIFKKFGKNWKIVKVCNTWIS